MGGLLAAPAQWAVLGFGITLIVAALTLLWRMNKAIFDGRLLPREVVENTNEAWKAADETREAARKEEREQVAKLMGELIEALHSSRPTK